MKKAVLYYFSGTGNTKLIAELIVSTLKDRAYTPVLVNIEDNEIPGEHLDAELIGLITPIYAFGLPKNVEDFVSSLPRSKKQKAFSVFTDAGCSGVAVLQVKYYFGRKNYNLLSATSLNMPDTWILVMDSPSQADVDKAYDKAKTDVTCLFQNIESKNKRFSSLNVFLYVLLWVIYRLFYYIGRHTSGKAFTTNDKCTLCKKCANKCPSKTIKVKKSKLYWSWNCYQCFRCINTCPHNAVEISTVAFALSIFALLAGWYPYTLIPQELIPSALGVNIILAIFSYAAIQFIVIWFIQLLLYFNLLPKWYITTKRRRYLG